MSTVTDWAYRTGAGPSADERATLVRLLARAYWMEIETVMSYIAGSVNPDGVRAREVAEALADDVSEELGHALKLARRIKELGGTVPGSLDFLPEQDFLQPPERAGDIAAVIGGVLQAERSAIDHYNRVVEFANGVDWVTQDVVIEILRDEEAHHRLFESYLVEYSEAASR